MNYGNIYILAFTISSIIIYFSLIIGAFKKGGDFFLLFDKSRDLRLKYLLCPDFLSCYEGNNEKILYIFHLLEQHDFNSSEENLYILIDYLINYLLCNKAISLENLISDTIGNAILKIHSDSYEKAYMQLKYNFLIKFKYNSQILIDSVNYDVDDYRKVFLNEIKESIENLLLKNTKLLISEHEIPNFFIIEKPYLKKMYLEIKIRILENLFDV